MCASRMASRCTSRDLGVGAKCALGRALSLKGRCIPSLLWHAAPIDMCISDEGVKGVRERWVVGRESACRCPLRAGSRGRARLSYRPRVPGLSRVCPRRPGTEHTVERPCDA